MDMRLRRMTFWLLVATLGLSAAERREAEEYAIWLSEAAVGPRMAQPNRVQRGRVRMDAPELERLARAVDASQKSVRTALREMGLPITGSTRYLLNAVFVEATAEQAARLRSLAGVRGVVRMQRYRVRLNTALDLINVPQAWTALGGSSRAGAGMRIAIIDSGFDHTHPALQGPRPYSPRGLSPRAAGGSPLHQ